MGVERSRSMKLFVVAFTFVLAVPTLHADVALQVEPAEAMLDEPVAIRVTGLPPNAECLIRAWAPFGKRVGQGVAKFKADERGVVDVSKQAPLEGTYSGVDPMGLVWSMALQDNGVEAPPLKITDPRVVKLEVVSGGNTVGSAELKRWIVRPGVRITEIKENGLVGKLFEPAGSEKRPGLLVLSGSEGGFSETEAALLASHGYVTLALAYFGVDGLPKQLVEIPLEYLQKGVAWLGARESVDKKRLGVVGGSKGGELSLLLASHTPELRAVVARAPSHVVWSGVGGNYRQSSWTMDGKPMPFLLTSLQSAPMVFAKNPMRLIEIYGPAIDDEEAVKKALIPVEKINGAVLLLTGTDDAMWPASRMADAVVARLKANGHRFPAEHLKYEGAGHGIPSAYVRMEGTIGANRMAFGGTPEANARAMADSRPKVLRFLQDNLKAQPADR